ncbi:hypothetical protein MHYP_G00148970 [Metynnis hypsauchen]
MGGKYKPLNVLFVRHFTKQVLEDLVWMVWGIGAYVYDYFHTSAMEERIHTLESVLTVHQFVIMFLSASLIVLISYIVFKKR